MRLTSGRCGVGSDSGRDPLDCLVNLIGGLLIEHKLELGSEPSQTRAHLARLLGHRDEEKADQRRHRNQRRSKRNPKAASAIGRDK